MNQEFKPRSGELYQCSNPYCEVIFGHLDTLISNGVDFYACPECWSIDFIVLPRFSIRVLFHHLIEHDWPLVRRNELRMIAEDGMAPYNPADHDR